MAHNHLKVDCAIDRKCKSVLFILLLCGWSIPATLYPVLTTLPLCWPPRPAPVSWPVPCPGKLQERSRVLGAPGSWGWRAWSHDHQLGPSKTIYVLPTGEGYELGWQNWCAGNSGRALLRVTGAKRYGSIYSWGHREAPQVPRASRTLLQISKCFLSLWSGLL